MRIVAMLALCGLCAGSTLAIESDAKADVYDQVSTVISKLIQKQIATRVVPNAAAKIPGACNYFPGSLRAMQQGRFAALPSVARQEGADAIGYLVWEKIAGASESGAQVALAATTDKIPQQSAAASVTNDGTTDDSKPTEGGQTATTVCGTTDSATSTQKMSACSAHKVKSLTDEVGCSIGLLARDSVMGDRDAARADAKRFVVALAMRLVDKWPKYVVKPAGTVEDTAKVEAALIDFVDTLVSHAEKDTVDTLVALLSQRLSAAAGLKDVAAEAAKLEKFNTDKALLSAAKAGVTASLATKRAMKQTEDVAIEIAKLEKELQGHEEALKKLDDEISKLASDASGSAKELSDFVEKVLKQIANAPNNAAAADDVLAAIAGAAKVCENKTAHVCTTIEKVNQATKSPDAQAFIGLLAAVSRHDYGLSVGIGIDAVLRPVCTWLNPCADAKVRKERLERVFGDAADDRYSAELAREFVSRVTVMLVDAKTGSQSVDSTDVVVGLADELMEVSGDASGIRRRFYEPKSMFVPTLAIRYGWIPGHYDADGKSATHLFFTVEEANIHGRLIYYENFYLGAHLSFLDLLAPFAEMANRPQNFSGDSQKVAISALFTPRLDLVATVPSLTRNLVVGAGVGLHMFRLSTTESASTPFDYCFIGGSCTDGKNGVAQFAEVSLSVKLMY